MGLVVREAEEADWGAACTLWHRAEAARTGRQADPAATRELVAAVATATAKPGAHLLVGQIDRQLVAVVYGVPLRTVRSKAQVAMLGVDPARWGEGIGSQLLAALTDALRQQGCLHLRMNVDPSNQRARALYERHGWQHLGETERAADTDVDELIYRKDLHGKH